MLTRGKRTSVHIMKCGGHQFHQHQQNDQSPLISTQK